MTCGIYMITNKKTGQKYIGQSVNIENRIYQHNQPHTSSTVIDREINKYGIASFTYTILEVLDKISSVLNEREKYWINKYNTFKDDFHYNQGEGGKGNPYEYNTGWQLHTPQARIKRLNSLWFNREKKKMLMFAEKGWEKFNNFEKEIRFEKLKKDFLKFLSYNIFQNIPISICSSINCSVEDIKKAKKRSLNKTSTGVFHVSLKKRNNKNTFSYELRNNKQVIYRKQRESLFELREEVVKEGYEWIIIDNSKYLNFLKLDNAHSIQTKLEFF